VVARARVDLILALDVILGVDVIWGVDAVVDVFYSQANPPPGV
jgi:hypothetical protein